MMSVITTSIWSNILLKIGDAAMIERYLFELFVYKLTGYPSV